MPRKPIRTMRKARNLLYVIKKKKSIFSFTFTPSMYADVYVCERESGNVCVRVCVSERERQRERTIL